jgi:hypothetical protein
MYINLLEAPVLAFFISFMVKYYNLLDKESPGYTFSNNENIPVYFFMSVVVCAFFRANHERRRNFQRQKNTEAGKVSSLKQEQLFVLHSICHVCHFGPFKPLLL